MVCMPSAKVSILNSRPSSAFCSLCCVVDVRSLCDCRFDNIACCSGSPSSVSSIGVRSVFLDCGVSKEVSVEEESAESTESHAAFSP